MSSEHSKRATLHNRMSVKEPIYEGNTKLAMIKNFNKNEKSINQIRRLTTMDNKRLGNFRKVNPLYH